MSKTKLGQPGYLKGVPKSPEHRAKIAAAMKGKKKSPEHVAKMSAAFKGKPNLACRGKPLSEEHRAKLSAAHTGKTLSPEHRAKIASSLTDLARINPPPQRYGLGREVTQSLRKRDGDLCQLCLIPIDFSLPSRTPESASVDHVTPVLAGGSDDPSNLWLAHLLCNAKKGARYVGRPDGTTHPVRS